MYIADLHIHSRYSRATSRDCTPEYLDFWARRKGIHIVGTGDFTHPAWRKELSEKLEPAEDGLYVLKEENRIHEDPVPGTVSPRFVVSGEISSIYKKNGKVRKVHSLILLPGLEDAEKIAVKLEQIGNIHSDGRPILGLDCHDLLEIVLDLCPEAVYVPAHIWTPHFSVFGAFSGFDSMEECFEDLTPYIHAVETGLSSDPPMNWRVSGLDRFQLISNSDAHSPARLGREANLLDISLSYTDLSRAICTGKGLEGTIEFFPEEGKYHMDGHRKCNLCLTPEETIKYGGKCPVCGKKITIGVSHRVEELADRPQGYVRADARRFESLVPLQEVIAAVEGHSSASIKVQKEYQRMLSLLGPEFEILRNMPLEDICRTAGQRTAEGIRRLRNRQVEKIPGFDGEYGVIRLFSAEELNNTEGQMNFFDMLGIEPDKKQEDHPVLTPAWKEAAVKEKPVVLSGTAVLNAEQEYAVRCTEPRIAVKAGPGTGKTKTLISRIRYLMEYRHVSPSEITAVTFTNQAASEMRERIVRETGKKNAGKSLQIGTFHRVCLDFLKEQGERFSLAEETEQKKLAEEALEETGLSISAVKFLEYLSMEKAGRIQADTTEKKTDIGKEGTGVQENNALFQEAFSRYEDKKKSLGLLDFDDLLVNTVKRISEGSVSDEWKKRFCYLLVDEFQDISPIQMQLVKLWSEWGRELFVIGDPDQSIYGFRGADAFCFDRLKNMYPDLKIISLKENYRSSPQILKAAQSVISRQDSDREMLHANCMDNEPVRLAIAGSFMGEAVFTAKEIGRMAGGIGMLEAHQAMWERDGHKTRSFDEIAVLCRTHYQAELVEKCLRKESIPYIVSGRESFLSSDTVQNSLRFFHFLEQPPENISDLKECAENLWHIPWSPVLEQYAKGTLEKFRKPYQKKKPRKFMEEWAESLGLGKDEAMQKLQSMTVFYPSMHEFVIALELGEENDLKRCSDKKYTSDAVTIMTLHGSKGLEFPVVFICGAEKGSIPYESKNHPTDMDEERRLFYVGMTRAKEELILTASGEMSTFLEELPDEMIKKEQAGKKKEAENWHQMSLFE